MTSGPYSLYIPQGGLFWSPDAAYSPGALVQDALGALWVAGDYVGAPARVCYDTFSRPDADHWTPAPVGGVWAPVSDTGIATMAGGEGLLTSTGEGNTDTMLLGAALTGLDVEVLVHWSVSSTTSGHTALGLAVVLRYLAGNNGFIEVTSDGVVQIGGPDSTTSAPGTWPGAPRGTPLRTRARASGTTYYVRTWLAADPEPSTWDLTFDVPGAAPALGQVGLQAILDDGTDLAHIQQFSAVLLPTAPGTTGNTAFAPLGLAAP